MKYVKKIGVEIESCFDSESIYDEHESITGYRELKNDGSIDLNYEFAENGFEAMELISRPVGYHDAMQFIADSGVYTDYDGINSSMGLHFHLSFKKNIYYTCIFSKRFVDYFKKELLKKYGNKYELIKRFKNDYCAFKNYGDDIRYFNEMKSNSRYLPINFISAYQRHNTIEFRIFNTDTADVMQGYLKFLLSTVNSYLDKNLKKIKSSDIKVISNKNDFIKHENEMIEKNTIIDLSGRKKISMYSESYLKTMFNVKTNKELENEYLSISENDVENGNLRRVSSGNLGSLFS